MPPHDLLQKLVVTVVLLNNFINTNAVLFNIFINKLNKNDINLRG